MPDNHLLRLIDRHIDFHFRPRDTEGKLCHSGRASIDPEVRLRILLMGYLYGLPVSAD